jgi:hypothetical protein
MIKSLLTIIISATVAGSAFAGERTLKAKSLVAISKEAMKQAVRDLVEKDEAAFGELMADGKITETDKPLTVFLVDVDIFDGLDGIRLKGSNAELWVESEALEK